MHMLFSFLLVAGLTDGAGQNRQLTVADHGTRCGQVRGSIVVLVEGSRGGQGRAADRLADRFNSTLGFCQAVQVLRFDVEPQAAAELSAEGANGDLLVLRPPTPLGDAADSAFQWLSEMPRPRSIILIAHEQFDASAVSTDRLIASAHRSKTTIHTVHIASRRQGGGLFRHLKQPVMDGRTWLLHSIGEDEHSDAPAYTARMLKRLANATEGTACVAAVEPGAAPCQNLITDRIVVRAQPNPSEPVRQSNCDSSRREP